MESVEISDRTSRVGAWAVLAGLIVCVVLAATGRRLPEPRPTDAPPGEFSAARALAVLTEIARKPHPAGSEENDRVREVLIARLKALGVSVSVQSGSIAFPLENILVSIPGSASTGTVLCMAHYDSVPRGPGAADDGAGVVTWVEALRVLRAAEWRPKNDVLVLLTDGEELGLLGAQLFALESPLVDSIKAIVNLEAIGNGGPALLFELGRRNGARVARYADAVDRPAGASFAEAVYRRMPNDTDLSVFLRRGIPGFNLALAWGTPAYHATHDTPANLDPRSLQHMGDSALALVRDLGEAGLATLDAPDATFFDVFGLGVVRHPTWCDFAFLAIAILLTGLMLRRARPTAGAFAFGLLEHATRAGATVVLVGGAWWALDQAAAFLAAPTAWVAGNTTSGFLLFAGAALAGFGLGCFRTGTARDAAIRVCSAMIVWVALAVAAAAFLPGGSFVFYWPVILIGARALAPNGSAVGGVVRGVGAAAALFVVLPIVHDLTQLAQRVPVVAAAIVCASAGSAAGLLAQELRALARGPRLARVLPLVAGLALLAGSVVVARILGWRGGALWP